MYLLYVIITCIYMLLLFIANIYKKCCKKEFKENYRATLNTLPVTESQVSAIIAEANYAFRLNMFMFDELDGNAFKSTLSYICGVIKGKTDATT